MLITVYTAPRRDIPPLRRLRYERRLSIKEVSETTGLSPNTIYHLETGGRNDPSDAPYTVAHYVADACERRYYEAGGFGPEPEIDWTEDEDSAEFDQAEAAYTEWYDERSRMFWDIIVYKATDVVANHYEAIVRVAVSLCYQGTLSGFQVAEIFERVEGAERSAA